MTWTEFLIIYLSIGAPFGVHYFLEHRFGGANPAVLSKTVAVALFWCFYGVFLIFRRSPDSAKLIGTSNLTNAAENEVERKIQILLASFSDAALRGDYISFFDFRETIERYAGLTAALREAPGGEYENEIFTVAGRRNKEDLRLANQCLRRRNLLRLKTHREKARIDFLSLFEKLSHRASHSTAPDSFYGAALQLAETLGDSETVSALRRITNKIGEREFESISRAGTEKELWAPASSSDSIAILRTPSSSLNLAAKNAD